MSVSFRQFLLGLFLAASLAKASFGATPPATCEQLMLGTDASVKQAQTMSADWLARAGLDVRETLTNPWRNPNVERRHAEVWEVRGIPAHAKLVNTEGRIFRHYANKETIDAIKSSKVLMTAYLPYVEMAPGVYKKNWNDITGAFLTVPESSHQSVGVDAHGETYYYVDVKIPDGVPVIEVERNHIFVIPLKGNVRGWVRDIYKAYKATGEINPSYKDMVERIDANGGLDEYVGAVPIEIVGDGRAH